MLVGVAGCAYEMPTAPTPQTPAPTSVTSPVVLPPTSTPFTVSLNIGPTPTKTGARTAFNAIVMQGGTATFAFDFGDGATATSTTGIVFYAYVHDGEYVASVTATETGGRTATASQPIAVTDPPPEFVIPDPPEPKPEPTLTPDAPILTCPSTVSVVSSQPVAVNYEMPRIYSESAVTEERCTPPPGSLFSVGSTTVSCAAVDEFNRTASCAFTITVSLPPPVPLPPYPTMTCPSPATATSPDGNPVGVIYAAPIVSGGALPISLTCTPPSGSLFSMESTIVICTAVDSADRPTSCDFVIHVTSRGTHTRRLTIR